MQFRNPVFTTEGNIDCEINHPLYGWIPFTCNPNDAGAQFDTAALFAEMEPFAAPYTPAPSAVPTRETQQAARAAAYAAEADPLFFKWQAGKGAEGDWLAKREEIRARYPYPEGSDQ